MVAVGLLAVIIVGLLAMFYQTQRAFRAGMTQVDVLEGGRATMELIARELQETAASLDTIVTNVQIMPPIGYRPIQMELPGGGSVNLMMQNVSFLRRKNFLDPSGSDGWTGQSYQISNSVPIADGSFAVGTLYRLTVTNGTEDSAIVADAIYSAQVSAQVAKRPDFRQVADGIVHLRIWPQDGLGLPCTNFPPTVTVATKVDPDSRPDTYQFSSNGLPSYFEIELAILEPKAVEQMRARSDANKVPYLQKQAGRIHFFKRRVPVRSGPTYFAVTNVP